MIDNGTNPRDPDIYNWFTEGFDTADLKDAKDLLPSLTASKTARTNESSGQPELVSRLMRPSAHALLRESLSVIGVAREHRGGGGQYVDWTPCEHSTRETIGACRRSDPRETFRVDTIGVVLSKCKCPNCGYHVPGPDIRRIHAAKGRVGNAHDSPELSDVFEFRERLRQTVVCVVLNPCAMFEQGAPVHCIGRHRLVGVQLMVDAFH
jgi:hypothetical protein